MPIDPQVEALCKTFGIEERIMRRLHDVMLTREATFDSDIKALWEVCENASKPSGFLMVKIGEMEWLGCMAGIPYVSVQIPSPALGPQLDAAARQLLEVRGDFCARAAEEIRKCGVYIYEEPMIRPPGPFRVQRHLPAVGEVPGLPLDLQAAVHTPRLRAVSSRNSSRSDCHGKVSRPSTRERRQRPRPSSPWKRCHLTEMEMEGSNFASRKSKASEVRSAQMRSWKRWRAPPNQTTMPKVISMKGLEDTQIVLQNRQVLLEETNAGLMGGAPFLTDPAERDSA
ncbi:unnamed protein product [Durusdinium trenchii]|uniref:Uncharacterized protein n=1 Tax=Durusdinium trenchii TaxID=1381693 RepID=A0ABP0N5P7_9DINO